MEKKFRTTLRELILSSKDYSKFTKEELIMQYQIIMNQYDSFKNEMTVVESGTVNPNIANIKNIQKRTQMNMFSRMIGEVDSHLKIISDLINQ